MINKDLSIAVYGAVAAKRKPRVIHHWEYLDRFYDKVRKLDNGCWEWVGNVRPNGYGKFWFRKKVIGAHQAAYIMFKGEIPVGTEIDHLCHNADTTCNASENCMHRRCVNPDHLEAITHQENSLRGRRPAMLREAAAKRTHCKYDHLLTERNTYVTPTGGRACRICLALNNRAYKARKKRQLC